MLSVPVSIQPSKPHRARVTAGSVQRWAFLVVGLSAASSLMAQVPQALWVDGRVSAGFTLSNNGSLTADGRSEQAFNISPGVRVVANGARVKGSLDYSLRALYRVQNTGSDSLEHALNSSGSIEVWDGRAFVDASAVVSDQTVSAFGPSSGSGIADTNRSETLSYRFSPYLKGRVAGAADYELRYALARSDTRQAARSDSHSQDFSLQLRGVNAGPLTWTAQAQAVTTDYSQARKIHSDSARLNLNYIATQQLVLTLTAGTERNNELTTQKQSSAITGVGADWRPSGRSRVFLNIEDRYFGNAHSVQAEHRTGLTLWRLSDSRNVSNSPSQAASASLGNLYDLIDGTLLSSVPDPIERAQRVQAELLRLGLPGNLEVFQSVLSSSATLARNQSLSAIVQGRRTVLTATVNRSRTSRLQSAITLGDDFDNNNYLLQEGFSLAVAHRLTPQTSVSATWNVQQTEGNPSGQSARTRSMGVSLNTQLGRRTSGGLSLRRSAQNGTTSSYAETSFSGTVNHRF